MRPISIDSSDKEREFLGLVHLTRISISFSHQPTPRLVARVKSTFGRAAT